MFNTLHDAISWIETQIKFRPKTDLERMHQAYQMLGVDLSNIKKIHVAGTNGKGSVASYISQILIESNLKVGTYTSPYLVRFNERIRFQMDEISDSDLFELIDIIYDFNQTYIKTFGENLSFFELITLMSFLYFKKMEVDVMVIEVGLGGLYDATNVLNYDLSLITSIGFDHMKQLGNTLESISFNKLGILKDKNHLITTVSEDLHPYFLSYLKEMDVTYTFLTLNDVKVISHEPISFFYQNEIYTLSLKGHFQILNGLISICAVNYLFPLISKEVIKQGLLKTKWAGRMEMIDDQVYLDGAHNTHAISALKDTILTSFKDKNVYVLFSALADKDIIGMLNLLRPYVKKIYLTSFPDSRFVDLEGITEDTYIKDPFLAIESIKKTLKKDDLLLITGSLHFAGYIKGNYQK
jgi:dihydrofolate synthase/folylpolyglutamate synthase